MSDPISLESFGETWDETYTEEDTKETTEANLVARGRYEGLLQPDTMITIVASEDGTNPFEGKKMARCHAILYTDEGERHFWFDACPVKIKVEARNGGGSFMATASQNAGHLYKATKMYNKPFPEVLRFATENRLVYDVGVRKATEEYPAKNVLRGAYAPTQEAT